MIKELDRIKTNKQLTLDSREVANMLIRSHSDVMKMIQGSGKNLGIIPILLNANLMISDYFIESSYKDNSGKENKCYLVTESGCLLLGSKLQGDKGIIFTIKYKNNFKNLRESCNEINKYKYERKEIKFIDKLGKALNPFGIEGERQYIVKSNNHNYRIDYYIPSLNIAIEYDENDHNSYTYEQQQGRQADIEQEIGCKFIRVSDSKSDAYNIGYILKEILINSNSTKCVVNE